VGGGGFFVSPELASHGRNGRTACLPEVEHVKDAICVDAHRPADGRRVGPEAHRVGELADGRGRHGLLLLLLVGGGQRRGLAAPAADALGDVDAGLSGVAGLAWVEGLGVVGGGGGGIEAALRVGPLSLRVGPSARTIASVVVAVAAAAIAAISMASARLGGRQVALLGRRVARRRLQAGVDGVVVQAGGVPLALGASLGRARWRRHFWRETNSECRKGPVGWLESFDVRVVIAPGVVMACEGEKKIERDKVAVVVRAKVG
jgi:hypothetical protein